MTVPSAQRPGSPRGTPADRPARPDPASTPVDRVIEPPPERPAIDAICPYLAAGSGAWRSSSPHRDHRCRAVEPPAPLAADKQRRLCLVVEHHACQTYRAARASRATTLAPGLDPALVAAADAARRPIARSAAVVLEHPRLGGPHPRWPIDRALSQPALAALMVLALLALLVARLSAGDGPPASPGAAASPLASVTASPSASPSRLPSATPSTSPSASASAGAPSPSASFRTYRVQRGDTLVGIAAEFGTTVAALRELNGIEGSALTVGQILRIPEPAAP